MNILAISQFFPYPPINGGKMRVYQLLRGLSRENTVHLLTFSSSPGDSEHVAHLREFCEDVHAVKERPFRAFSPRAVAGLFSSAPRSYVAGWSRDMAALVDRHIRGNGYDAAIAFGLRNGIYLSRYTSVVRIIDNENCDTAFAARLADSAQSSLIKFRRKLTWVKSKQYESKLAAKFDAALVVSDEDKSALADVCPSLAARDAIHVIPNGTDLSLLSYQPATVDRRMIVSPGALTYSANYDAARYFCDCILPLIREAIPEAVFTITGGTDGVDLRPFHNMADVRFTGYLDDVRPAIAGSAVVVVPTRIGGGTRLKILEAMALGTPVVATSFGASGIGATHGDSILIGDTPKEFAEHVCALMKDDALRDRIAENAKRFVASRFGWESISDSLLHVVKSTRLRKQGL